MVDVDVEVDDVAAVIGGGERVEAAGDGEEAVEAQDFDCEGEFLRGGGEREGVGRVGEREGGRGRGRRREKVVRENEEGEDGEEEDWEVVPLGRCHCRRERERERQKIGRAHV